MLSCAAFKNSSFMHQKSNFPGLFLTYLGWEGSHDVSQEHKDTPSSCTRPIFYAPLVPHSALAILCLLALLLFYTLSIHLSAFFLRLLCLHVLLFSPYFHSCCLFS
ncbi:hypothetical protein AMECASPLE_004035 [Ameca splendens]|uniref:Uncharacterized protein n=1 Tax=Ameca splendens TaxID=208324 RepID=A0ABV0Z819_9TELE